MNWRAIGRRVQCLKSEDDDGVPRQGAYIQVYILVKVLSDSNNETGNANCQVNSVATCQRNIRPIILPPNRGTNKQCASFKTF